MTIRFALGAAVSVLSVSTALMGQAVPPAVKAAEASIDGEKIRAHVKFLADDLLEGRGTGTRGHEIAAKFMAAEFEAMGLEPAGDNGTFFQNVPLRSIRPDEERTTLSIVRGRREEALTFRTALPPLRDPTG